jgi:broad specificity phosphatase PhoE
VTGEVQARTLGARRQDDRLAAVFCSDLTRAFQTAEIAFRGRRLPIVRDSRLRECNYGDLTRHSAGEIEARRTLHVDTPFPNGESYRQVAHRVSAWLADAVAAHAGDTVLVVGHRATFYALEHLLNHTRLEDVVVAPWDWQPGWTYRV